MARRAADPGERRERAAAAHGERGEERSRVHGERREASRGIGRRARKEAAQVARGGVTGERGESARDRTEENSRSEGHGAKEESRKKSLFLLFF